MEEMTSLSTVREVGLIYECHLAEEVRDIPVTEAEATRWTMARMAIHVYVDVYWMRGASVPVSMMRSWTVGDDGRA